jgi:hypothetical protein
MYMGLSNFPTSYINVSIFVLETFAIVIKLMKLYVSEKKLNEMNSKVFENS